MRHKPHRKHVAVKLCDDQEKTDLAESGLRDSAIIFENRALQQLTLSRQAPP